MADGNHQFLSPEEKCRQDSSSFNTASDESQEEVNTVRKKDNGNRSEEGHRNSRGGDEKEEMKDLEDIKTEESHRLSDRQMTLSTDDSGASVKSCHAADADSTNEGAGSKSIVDRSKSRANKSASSTSSDSRGAKDGAVKGIGQRLHQGTAASKARQGKKVTLHDCTLLS